MKLRLCIELDREKAYRVVEFDQEFTDVDDAYDCPDVTDALEEFIQDKVASWVEIVSHE